MAIKIGQESKEGVFKLYQGVGAFNVVAVNPTKAELEKIQNRTIEEEPEYKGKDDDGNDTIRLAFYIKTNPEAPVNNGIEMNTVINFNLTKIKKVGANSGKIQIIDKYGRTAWATEEEFKNKQIPMYKSGPANISANYRPAFSGEEFLIKFLIEWLNIPNPATYNNETKKWTDKADASDSEVSLNVDDIFSNNLKEIKELIKLAEPYMVKAAVGVKSTDEGRQYQQVFNRDFCKNAITNYSKLDKAIQEFKNNGGAVNVEYDVQPLHEYTVEPTNFSKESTSEMPFDAPADSPWN